MTPTENRAHAFTVLVSQILREKKFHLNIESLKNMRKELKLWCAK